MSLSNEQYNRLMLEYSRTRERHRQELRQRKMVIYAKIPEYQELDESIPGMGTDALRRKLFGAGTGHPEEPLSARLLSIRQKKRQLLVRYGYPEDYLDPVYDCSDCRDTGYIDGVKCHCLRAREISLLYDQSHLKDLIQSNNFSLLSEAFYEDPEDLAGFRRAEQACHEFINNFSTGYENLYFYGTVGTGKSFLSICTAGEILNRGHSVLYFTATGLFDQLSGYVFGTGDRAALEEFRSDLYTCDLLVIDDLGTEMTNSFVTTNLFGLINERDLNRRATIISTNLSLGELQNRYSDRILSRITYGYKICKLTGPDIRILKKTHIVRR